eukprot:g1742.t1
MFSANCRVVIKDLKSRSELNGVLGIVKNSLNGGTRYAVQLDKSGEIISLKPANLENVCGPSSTSSMWQEMFEQHVNYLLNTKEIFPKLNNLLKTNLPLNVRPYVDKFVPERPTPTSILLVLLAILFLLWSIFGLVLLCVLCGASYLMLVHPLGRFYVQKATKKCQEIVQKPVKPWMLVAVVAIVLFFLKQLTTTSSSHVNMSDFRSPEVDAYNLGYNDALAGRERSPPFEFSQSASSSSSSSWSFFKYLRLFGLISMIFKLGKTSNGFSLALFVQNAKNLSLQHKVMYAFMLISLMW